jgi:excisionase family DNA binding protein
MPNPCYTSAMKDNTILKQTVPPMKYTLGDAAKATGVSKPTISRAIKSGKISGAKDESGIFQLDPAEVHRVWPMKHHSSNDDGTLKQTVPSNNEAALQAENTLLRQMVEKAEERETHWRKQAEHSMMLLEDGRPRQGFWARLTGKG